MNSFDIIFRQYESGIKDPQYFKGFYIDMEQLAKKLFANRNIQDGFQYYAPLQYGGHFRFIFHPKCTELYYTTKNGKESCLISEDASVKQEYSRLEYLSETSDFCIGRKVPDEMLNLFFKAHIEPGDVLTLGRKSFVCCAHYGATFELKPLYTGDIKKATIDEFSNHGSTITLQMSDDYQNLYNAVKNIGTAALEFKVSKNGMNRGEILKDNAERSLLTSKQHAKSVHLGNEDFVIKKSRFGGKCDWFDASGKKLSGDAVKSFLAWLNSKPVDYQFPYIARIHDDIERCKVQFSFQEKIDTILHQKDFKALTELYCQFAAEIEDGAISVNLSSYQKENDNFIPVSYIVQNKENCPTIYRVRYVNDNFENDIEEMIEITKDEFSVFLERIYDDTFCNILQTKEEEYLRQNGILPEQVHQEFVAEAMNEAEIALSAEKVEYSNTDIEAMVNEFHNLEGVER